MAYWLSKILPLFVLPLDLSLGMLCGLDRSLALASGQFCCIALDLFAGVGELGTLALVGEPLATLATPTVQAVQRF